MTSESPVTEALTCASEKKDVVFMPGRMAFQPPVAFPGLARGSSFVIRKRAIASSSTCVEQHGETTDMSLLAGAAAFVGVAAIPQHPVQARR